jgi:aspartate aminotransferase
MTARAREMKSQGIDVISFAAGEPDFNTPEPIVAACVDALAKGMTKYAPSKGVPALVDAVVAKFERENGIHAKGENIIVSCGAKHSVYNSLMVLVEPGDEVILLAPYWMTYADQIVLAGGTPVIVNTTAESGFVPEIDAIKEKITSRTKAIIINSPNNPTGGAMGRQTLKEIAALALRHGFWVISDEIYERLVYGHEHVSIASLGREIADQTITINGVSKTYAMTGWRIGYLCAPAPVAKAIANLQDQVTSNATTFAQVGAAAALGMPDDAVEAMRAEFEARRAIIVSRLNAIPGVMAPEPKGAFYAFPDVSGLLGGAISDDLKLAEHLLDAAHIACVPGSVFEGRNHLRFSYAASRADIERGMDRFAEAAGKLRT